MLRRGLRQLRLGLFDATCEFGAAHAFARSAGTWSEVAKLVEDVSERGSYFGFDVAASADAAVVGAYVSSLNGGTFDGAAFHYTRDGASGATGAS